MTHVTTRGLRASDGVRPARSDDRTRVFRAMGLALPERGGAPWLHAGADGGIGARTRVQTIEGLVAAEDLKVGDRLFTRDSGPATLRWIGRVDLASARAGIEAEDGMSELERELAMAEAEEVMTRPALRVAPGAFARDVPFGEVVLAPASRLLLRGRAQGTQPARELLAEAHHLVGAMGIEECAPPESYLTLHLDRTEILYAEGMEIASGRPLAKCRETRRIATPAEIRAFAA